MMRYCVLIAALGAALYAQTPVQTCTVTNTRGIPIAGTVCGGSAISGSQSCTPGAIYNCNSGPLGTKNNCTLAQVCATSCSQTSGTKPSTSCFTGPAPFTVSPLNPLGGSDVNLNVNLTPPHTGAIINLIVDRGDLIPGASCAVPPLADTQTSAGFSLSTAVVAAPTAVRLHTDVSYGDPAGNQAELISREQIVTLNPGGTEPPPPPIAAFTLDPPSIGPAGISFARVSLAGKAPASGVKITLVSSDPATASIIQNGQPFVLGSCTNAQVAENIQAASSVPQTTVVNISASSGAAGQAPLNQPLTVTNGCVPVACSGGPSCGPQPNGCGGVMNCGCADPNQTCGGGGVANQCGAPTLAVSGLSFSPTSVVSGSSATGTVTLNIPAPFNGAVVSLSSSSSFVTVPATVTVPSGQLSTTFTAATAPFQAGTASATISASLGSTVSAILNLTAASSCVPTTCSAQAKTCGTISDGCGGTLTCGPACVNSTGTVTLTVSGKGGKVTSSPSGLTVSSGNSGSASFNLGTSVTLTTDDGHGAIWSGLCSSGGVASQTCTFTVNTSGGVSSVQQ